MELLFHFIYLHLNESVRSFLSVYNTLYIPYDYFVFNLFYFTFYFQNSSGDIARKFSNYFWRFKKVNCTN